MSSYRYPSFASLNAKPPAKPSDLTRADDFITLQLGESRQSIRVPVMPPIFANTHEKAKCFDYFANQILPLRHVIPPAEIIAAYAKHFPINTMSAENEAKSIADKIYNAFFDVINLEGRGFFNSRGKEVIFKNAHTKNRPAGLDYFRFISTVNPATIDKRLQQETPVTIEFDLPLPQLTKAALQDRRSTNATHSTGPSPSTSAGGTGTGISTSSDSSTNADTAVNLFNTPTNDDLASTPKLLRALQHHETNQNSVGATYLGPLDFLENQQTFTSIWPYPTPVHVHLPTQGGIVDASVKLRALCDKYYVRLFNSIFRLDYVGSTENLDARTIEAIGTKLRRLTMVYTVKGETKYATPDSIYQRYVDELPMLPEDAETWGFNLVNMFWTSITETLKETLLERGYQQPPYKSMTTKQSQKEALATLRAEVVKHFAAQQRQESSMVATMRMLLNNKSSNLSKTLMQAIDDDANDTTPALPVSSYYQSPAEQTIRRELGKQHGKLADSDNPICSETGYVSLYPAGFRGCYGCGSANGHQFKDCPRKNDKATIALFHKEYKLHSVLRRKRDRVSAATFFQEPYITLPTVEPNQTSADATNPDNTQSPAPKRVTFAEQVDNGEQMPFICTQLVRIFHSGTQQTRTMPIPVNNGLPTFHLTLGKAGNGSINLGCLFDSCAAVSSGYKLFHWYLMSKYPEIVHSYEEYDNSENPFQPIKLAGAVRDKAGGGKDILGELTAVIRYHTPYKTHDGKPCIISFALSDDVTVNTIVGWPTISTLGMTMSAPDGVLTSTLTNQKFTLTAQEPKLGLPPGVTFEPKDFMPPATKKTQTTTETESSRLHQFAAVVEPPTDASSLQPPPAQPVTST